MASKICNRKMCIVCGTMFNLHRHHIFFGTANRKLSEEDGLWVYLCGRHHNLSNEGVHFNRELDIGLKKLGQKTYEKDHTREEFMNRYGKNYMGDEEE